jgi:Flp pilus assembly protein TadD
VIDLARSADVGLLERPEPYRLQGYCQARLGETGPAVDSMSKAVDREPKNWEYRYSLAVAQAAAGIDPRPAAREALRLDPLALQTRSLVQQLSGSDPKAWRQEARPLLEAPLL